jgi:hypothetical protein
MGIQLLAATTGSRVIAVDTDDRSSSCSATARM